VLRELISLYLIGDTRTCARLGLLLPDLKSIFIPILFPSSLINNLCPALTHPYLSSTHKAVVFPHARPTLSPSPTLAQVPHRLHRYAWYMALREVVRSGWQRTAALFSYQMSSGFIDLPYGFINLCGRGAPSFVSLSFSCPFALLLFDESDQRGDFCYKRR
jgi:hypothetical protein